MPSNTSISEVFPINSLSIPKGKELLISYLSELLVDLEWISIDELTQSISLDFSKALISIVSGNSILNTLIGDSINSITKTYIEEGEVSIQFESWLLG